MECLLSCNCELPSNDRNWVVSGTAALSEKLAKADLRLGAGVVTSKFSLNQNQGIPGGQSEGIIQRIRLV